MSAFSNYLEALILDTYLKNGTPYIGLHLDASPPGDTGANELTGNGYARQAATFGTAGVDGTGYKSVTTADITFPVATPSGWGTIGHISIWNAASGGNCLFSFPMSATKTIGAGERLQFLAGEISVKTE